MRRIFCALFLMSVLALVQTASAQEWPQRGPATFDPLADSTIPTTYRGCVIRFGDSVVLSGASSWNYKLVSDLPSLDRYAGKEVLIRAVQINPGDPSSDERGSAAGNAEYQTPTLQVEEISTVADTCRSK
jgi:hypothetical protein